MQKDFFETEEKMPCGRHKGQGALHFLAGTARKRGGFCRKEIAWRQGHPAATRGGFPSLRSGASSKGNALREKYAYRALLLARTTEEYRGSFYHLFPPRKKDGIAVLMRGGALRT